MFTLYETIEELCRLNDESITRMCRDSGASRSSITDLKKGRSNTLTAETLEKLARHFHVSIEFLLDDGDGKFYYYDQEEKPAPEGELVNGDPELTAYIQDLKDRPELRMLFSLTHNATREDVERAVRVIEAIRYTDNPEREQSS